MSLPRACGGCQKGRRGCRRKLAGGGWSWLRLAASTNLTSGASRTEAARKENPAGDATNGERVVHDGDSGDGGARCDRGSRRR